MKVSSAFTKAIWALHERWISRLKSELAKKMRWTTKVSSSGLRVVAANFFFPTISTCLMIKTALTIVYKLHLSSQSMKLILILLKVRKDILQAIFMLISTYKKVFSKNWNFSSMSLINKEAITMPNVSSLLLSIFYTLISIF